MNLRVVAVVLLSFTSCGRTGLVEISDLLLLDDGGACRPLAVAEADQQLMVRWNIAVDAGPAPAPIRDFHWREVTDFPHPTFRGGSSSAYAEFVDVLLRFWGNSATLDFVRCQDLFDRAYKSGPVVATQKFVKLRPLTVELSASTLVDGQRRADLVQVCGLIGC